MKNYISLLGFLFVNSAFAAPKMDPVPDPSSPIDQMEGDWFTTTTVFDTGEDGADLTLQGKQTCESESVPETLPSVIASSPASHSFSACLS